MKIKRFIDIMFLHEAETKDKKGFEKKVDWRNISLLVLLTTIMTLMTILIFN